MEERVNNPKGEKKIVKKIMGNQYFCFFPKCFHFFYVLPAKLMNLDQSIILLFGKKLMQPQLSVSRQHKMSSKFSSS